MRNLLVFIWKNYFLFLFLLLETLCVYLLVSNNYFHQASFINSTNSMVGSAYTTYSDFTEYLHLRTQNEILAAENANLKSFVKESSSTVSTKIQTINDTIYHRKYTFLSAKVVNNSTNRRNNYLTLNIGSKQGITRDMAVICSGGVVGLVKDVSDNFCSVMSLLHKDSKISSKLKKDGSFGPLFWEGDDYRYATLIDIPTHVKLVKGDTIVTSAFSTIFPEGIMVGTVESYELKAREYFYTVRVRLSTDFKKLNYVYVINNLMKNEQEELETRSQVQPNDK